MWLVLNLFLMSISISLVNGLNAIGSEFVRQVLTNISTDSSWIPNGKVSGQNQLSDHVMDNIINAGELEKDTVKEDLSYLYGASKDDPRVLIGNVMEFVADLDPPTTPAPPLVFCDWPDQAPNVSMNMDDISKNCTSLKGNVVIEKPDDKLHQILHIDGSLSFDCSPQALEAIDYFSSLRTVESPTAGSPALTICLKERTMKVESARVEKFKQRLKLKCGNKVGVACFLQLGWVDPIKVFARSLLLARKLPGATVPSGLTAPYEKMREILQAIFITVSVVCPIFGVCAVVVIIYIWQSHKPRIERKPRGILYRIRMRVANAEREVLPLHEYKQTEAQHSNENLMIPAAQSMSTTRSSSSLKSVKAQSRKEKNSN